MFFFNLYKSLILLIRVTKFQGFFNGNYDTRGIMMQAWHGMWVMSWTMWLMGASCILEACHMVYQTCMGSMQIWVRKNIFGSFCIFPFFEAQCEMRLPSTEVGHVLCTCFQPYILYIIVSICFQRHGVRHPRPLGQKHLPPMPFTMYFADIDIIEGGVMHLWVMWSVA